MLQDINEERWSELFDFPGYSVSDHGRVLNVRTGFYIKASKKTHGYHMVGLMKNAVQHKRSLPLLVARAFLPRPENPAFDTPIHLDGDRGNSHYNNLMWRPLWFARRYMRQFVDDHNTYAYPIEDVETGELYKDSMHAASYNGLIDTEIRSAMLENTYVWPTGQIFRAPINR